MKELAFKKSIYTLFTAILTTAPLVASAQWAGNWQITQTAAGLPRGDNVFTNGASSILVNIMKWLLGIFGSLAIIAFVVAGIMYLFSGGDEARATSARKVVVYAIIGVIVAMAGLVIITLIDAALSGETTF